MYKSYLKRAVDIIICLLVLPLFVPICILVAIIIKLDDEGPIFYNGKRLGKDLKEFSMIKFRTMKVNAPDIRNEDGSTFNSENDPRLTAPGKVFRKTSIDELPQIINVLKGDMSLIGPRPSPLGNKDKYTREFLRKFEIRPGITGYNQVKLRNRSTMEQRIKNDLYYIENISFMLDLKIFCMTILAVLKARDINRNDRSYDNYISESKTDLKL
jgi:lipopolysaccharide/colanic/teichoic acid biosynthesis glycosyltransferase